MLVLPYLPCATVICFFACSGPGFTAATIALGQPGTERTFGKFVWSQRRRRSSGCRCITLPHVALPRVLGWHSVCSCWCNADSLCKPLVMCYRRRVKLKVDVESDLHKLEVDAREWRERVHQLESR